MNVWLKSFALPLLLTASAAFAEYGWTEYDTSKPQQLSGTIEASSYANPYVTMRLRTDEKNWTVVLTPPQRMRVHGVSPEMLGVGKKVGVTGYRGKFRVDEMRADSITLDGKTIVLD
jgi:hypothetical protein